MCVSIELTGKILSVSTSSCLEIYGLNLAESGHDMPCLARQDHPPLLFAVVYVSV
jgi:hypothetical protein